MTRARALQAAFVAVCVLVAVGFVRAAGGTAKFEPQVDYIAIIAAAIWFGSWGGALVGAVCGLLVGPLMPSNIANGTPQHLGVWLPRLVYFIAIGAAFGMMQQRLRQHLHALEKARDDLEKRNRELAEAEQRAEEQVRELTAAHSSEANALIEIGALSHLDAAVQAGQGEGAILETIAEIVCTAMGAHCGLVVYLAEGSNSLSLRAQSGLHGDSATKMAEIIGRLRRGQGLPWRAIVARQPVRSFYVSGDGDADSADSPDRCIGAPLMADDEPFGAICAIWRQERKFVREEGERMGRLAGQASLAIQKARQNRVIEDVTFDTILALADAIESRASHTQGHVARIVQYAEATARVLQLPEPEVRAIRYGAALHDVGMVGVPDEIIKKPGQLTHEEKQQIRLHPYIGGQFCKQAGFLAPLMPIIYHHHERFDGRGYPDGLCAHQIPLGARIVAAADAYDAMTTERPYRPALSFEDAAEALRDESGRQLDPEVIEALLEAVEGRRLRSIKAA